MRPTIRSRVRNDWAKTLLYVSGGFIQRPLNMMLPARMTELLAFSSPLRSMVSGLITWTRFCNRAWRAPGCCPLRWFKSHSSEECKRLAHDLNAIGWMPVGRSSFDVDAGVRDRLLHAFGGGQPLLFRRKWGPSSYCLIVPSQTRLVQNSFLVGD